MSQNKKDRIQITWGTIATVLLVANLSGVMDLKKYARALESIPEMQKVQEDHGKKINQIMEILHRNKLVRHELKENSMSTAQYD